MWTKLDIGRNIHHFIRADAARAHTLKTPGRERSARKRPNQTGGEETVTCAHVRLAKAARPWGQRYEGRVDAGSLQRMPLPQTQTASMPIIESNGKSDVSNANFYRKNDQRSSN